VKPKDQQRVVVEVTERVVDAFASDPHRLEQAIFDTLYEERRRLETERDRATAARQATFYDRIQAQALRSDAARHKALLRELVANFAQEVVGHFDERVYALSTRAVPAGLSMLLHGMSPLRLAGTLRHGSNALQEHLELSGGIEAVQRCARAGTVVLVPTHLSNLDSIVIGYGLYRMGLPPFLYGAGLNLFHNRIIGYFMHNLGAYKVDRRKQAGVYKDVLKAYAEYSLELGYHNLFFPGGTRSRSGAVETRLKLGLLGTGLQAYVRNLVARRQSPDVFVVPCTINYELVLEAETLIEDFLREAGKSRYIIEDDEFSRPRVVFEFMKKLLSLDSSVRIVVGRPLDVFGNEIDQQGESLDAHGRVVDRTRYVLRDGEPVLDRQRDEEYTRELAGSIVRSFERTTVLQATNVLCRVVFDWLKERSPGMDLYRLLRTGGPEDSLPMTQVYERLAHVQARLAALADTGGVVLSPLVRNGDPVEVASHALKLLGSYHRRPALQRRGDRLFHLDRNLILYYQNRTQPFDLTLRGAP
jgi:glycerol-3-phosphate O-acyltransferase